MVRAEKDIDTIVIHCAATPNGLLRYGVDEIDSWHQDNGWRRTGDLSATFRPELKAIGYHGVIDPHGEFWPGRHVLEVGAHAGAYNHRSLGLCLIGTDAFTMEAWITLRSQVRAWLHQLPRMEAVIGHNEISPKECPGFDVQSWVQAGMGAPEGHICEARA